MNIVIKKKTLKFSYCRSLGTSVLKVLQSNDLGKKVKIQGWVKSVRKHKKHVFVDICDGSTQDKIQATVPQEIAPPINPGSSLSVQGVLQCTPKGELELLTQNINILCNCLTTEGYPFAPGKKYSSEYVRKFLHLRSRYEKFSSLLRIRSTASLIIHNLFHAEGYIYIHTPILTSNDCEGAGEVFKAIPDNANLLKAMLKENIPLQEAFFDTKTFLSVSGQLHLEAAAYGLNKVYSFGPTFRAENSKTKLHLSEFYMLEAEIAFLYQISDLTVIIERLIKNVTKSILDTCHKDTKVFFEENQPDFTWIDKSFPILTYDEAVKILKDNESKIKRRFCHEEGFSKDHELFLVNYCGGVPTFIIHWPKSVKPFYMKECENDSSKVAALDLLAPICGEIVGGSLRENSYIKLKEKLPKNSENLEWYLELRKFGGLPTGGFGLGFERYLLFLLGLNNIKDTIPFPRWPHNCSL